MNDFYRRLKDLISKKSKMWKTVVLSLAAIVVFATTYALILPAITLEVEEAEMMSGIDVGTAGADDFSADSVVLVEPADEFAAAGTEADFGDDFSSTETAALEKQEHLEQSPVIFDTDAYRVVLTFDENAGIPKGTKLEAAELDEEDASFYQEKTLSKLKETLPGSTPVVSVFHQISLTKDGERVIPQAPVDIRIEYWKHTIQHAGEKSYGILFGDNPDEVFLKETNNDDTPAVGFTDNVITSLTLKQVSLSDASDVFGLICAKPGEETKESVSEEPFEEGADAEEETDTDQAEESTGNVSSEEETSNASETDGTEKEAADDSEMVAAEEETTDASEADDAEEETEDASEADDAETEARDALENDAAAEESADQETTDAGTYGIVGGSAVYLSEVIDQLEDEEISDLSVDQIENITFSDESLFEATQTPDGDWLVDSKLSEADVELHSESDRQQEMTLQLEDKEVSVALQIEGVENTEDPLISIRSADGVFLPEEADGYGQVLTEEAAESAVSAVEEYVSSQEETENL